MEDHSSIDEQSIHIHYEKTFTTREEYTSSPPQNHINFKFSCKPFYFQWVLNQNLGPILNEDPTNNFVNRPVIDNEIRLGLSDFISNEPRRTLEEVLKDWPVNANSRRNFVDYVMTRVKEKYIRMPCRHNSIFLEFQVTAIQRHRVDERRVVEKEDGDYRTCSICLEEFSVNNGDCEGMPCSHIFHGDCIKKWLSTSHSCPVCRFEYAYE